MARSDIEKELEELREWKHQQEIKEAEESTAQRLTQGKVIFRCSTVAIAIAGALTGIGSWAADNLPSIDAAVRAFIAAKKGVQ